METSLNRSALARRHRVNWIQSFILIASQFLLLALTGWIVAGFNGLLGLVLGSIPGFLFARHMQPEFMLRLLGAKLISPDQAPQMSEAVAALARRSGLKKVPRLGYRPTNDINAFSVGHPKDAIIVLTEGLLRALDGRQMAGVLAHEVSHVAANDMGIMALADFSMKLTGFMGRLGILFFLFSIPATFIGAPKPSFALIAVLIVAPIISGIVQLALSRTREFEADANAASITGDPHAMMSALTKISEMEGDSWERLFIPGRKSVELSVLRSHPSTRERVQRLRELVEPDKKPHPLRLTELDKGSYDPSTDAANSRSPKWRLGGWW
jgi:heat shock protein HtpX